MKRNIMKIVYAVILASLALGCEPVTKFEAKFEAKNESGSSFRVIEVEANGEWHEYLYRYGAHEGGLAHLPNCRFCKR